MARWRGIHHWALRPNPFAVCHLSAFVSVTLLVCLPWLYLTLYRWAWCLLVRCLSMHLYPMHASFFCVYLCMYCVCICVYLWMHMPFYACTVCKYLSLCVPRLGCFSLCARVWLYTYLCALLSPCFVSSLPRNDVFFSPAMPRSSSFPFPFAHLSKKSLP